MPMVVQVGQVGKVEFWKSRGCRLSDPPIRTKPLGPRGVLSIRLSFITASWLCCSWSLVGLVPDLIFAAEILATPLSITMEDAAVGVGSAGPSQSGPRRYGSRHSTNSLSQQLILLIEFTDGQIEGSEMQAWVATPAGQAALST